MAQKGAQDPYRMHNYEAALFAERTTEMRQMVTLLGGNLETVAGLPGVGDLYVTSTGGRRNRRRSLASDAEAITRRPCRDCRGSCRDTSLAVARSRSWFVAAEAGVVPASGGLGTPSRVGPSKVESIILA